MNIFLRLLLPVPRYKCVYMCAIFIFSSRNFYQFRFMDIKAECSSCVRCLKNFHACITIKCKFSLFTRSGYLRRAYVWKYGKIN